MSLTDDQIQALAAALDPKRVKQREGAARKRLSYIETWDAKRAANEIFGYGNWGYEIAELVDLGIEKHTSSNGREGHRVAYRCRLRLLVDDCHPVEDVGYGEDVSYTSVLQSHELAIKEAVSDALKRALVAFGEQFGLSLYDKDAAAPKRAAPKPVEQKATKKQQQIVITATKLGIDDELRHRLILLLTDGRTQSSKDIPDEHVDKIIEQLRFFAQNKDAGMAALRKWEAKQAAA